MPNPNLTLGIDARVTGTSELDRLEQALTRVGRSGDAAGKSTAGALSSFRGIAADVGKASEALLALAGAQATAALATAHYSATLIPAITSTDGLLNSYRALRFALAPTPFTAASIAVGFLTEETIRLVNARAKLIEQQSLISATSGISQSSIERIGSISSVSGGDAATIRSLYAALASRVDNNQSSVRSGLDTLGVSGSKGRENEPIDPSLLREIAAGFTSIEDPAKRAAAAVAIFGNEKAGEALKDLDRSFVGASDATQKFGIVLDSTARNQIYNARKEFLDLKYALLNFDTVKGWWESITTGTTIIAAATEDMTRRSLISLDGLISKYVPGIQALRGALAGPVAIDPLNPSSARKDSIGQGIVADGLFAEAQGQKYRESQTLEGQTKLQEAAQERANAAYRKLSDDSDRRRINPLDPSLLDGDQRFSLATQQQSASGLAATIGESVKALKAAKDAADAAAQTATDIFRHQQDAVRSSQELLFRSAIDPGAGRNLQGEILKASTFTDKNGDPEKFQLLDGTRRNLEAAFSAYALDLNRKASAEQIKNEDESFARRKLYEAQLFQQRIEYDAETARIDLGAIDQAFAHENVLAGYTRDERLRSTALTGVGLRGSDATRNALGQIGAQRSIEDQFALATAKNDSDALDRDRRRQLDAAGVDRFTGKITDGQFFDRNKAINSSAAQRGTEINDRYANDLLTAQQEAVQRTTEIIKNLENEQLDKFKSFSGGLFDSILGGGSGVSRFLESQLQSVAKTVFTNAAASFVYPELKNLIPHAGSASSTFGKLFKDTSFGADPTTALKTSTELNTAATDANTLALKTALSGPGRAGVGVGGGLAPGAINTGSIFGGSTASPYVFNAVGEDGLPVRGVGNAATLAPGIVNPQSGLGFNAKTVGAVTAAAGGGFAAFNDFKTGGAKNDVAGVGALLGSAAAITALIPGGQVVALGLGIASAATSLIAGLLPDPKKVREAAISKELTQNRYLAPTALNVAQDGSGNYEDFDSKGNLRQSPFRAVPQVNQPYTFYKGRTPYDVPGGVTSPYQPAPAPQIYVTIHANDAASFSDMLARNPHAVADAAATSLQDVHARLTSAIQYVAGR